MKKVIIITQRPETSHLLAAMLNLVFPECEIHISEAVGGAAESHVESASIRSRDMLDKG